MTMCASLAALGGCAVRDDLIERYGNVTTGEPSSVGVATQQEFQAAREAFASGDLGAEEWSAIANAYVAQFAINDIPGDQIVIYERLYDGWSEQGLIPKLDMYEVVPRLTQSQAEAFKAELEFGDGVSISDMLVELGVLDSAFDDTPAQRAEGGSRPEESASPAAEAAVDTSGMVDWAVERWGAFSPISKSGSGDAAFDLPGSASAFVAEYTYEGTDLLMVTAEPHPIDANGLALTDAFGVEEGPGSGIWVVGQGMPAGWATYSIEIQAEGAWTLDIYPIAALPMFPQTGTLAGNGSALYLHEGPAGGGTEVHYQGIEGEYFFLTQNRSVVTGSSDTEYVIETNHESILGWVFPERSLVRIFADHPWELSLATI